MSQSLSGISLSNVLSGTERQISISHGRSEDADIFDRFLTGDDAAAVKLFQKYNPRLFLYCSKVLGDPEQAEDVTQEIWERVIRLRAKPPQEVANPGGFLFRIARNLCINQMRGKNRVVPLSSVDESLHPSCAMPGSSDLEELVLSSLDALRFEDRELLILNVYCGYRLDEIATMMEMSPNAIWTRASRARAQLRTIISGMMASDDASGTPNSASGAKPKPRKGLSK